MGKLVVSLDGVVIKEVQITKDKTTLGRRPYNDIVIDNLADAGAMLVQAANAAGGRDNIAVVLARAKPGSGPFARSWWPFRR